MTPMLPAAPEIGTRVTAVCYPERTFRRNPVHVTGIVTAVGPNSLTVLAPGGYFSVRAGDAVRS